MIIEAIDTPDFIETLSSVGAMVSTSVSREYPNICVKEHGIEINCLKSEKGSWFEKIHPAFMEVFQSNNVPLVFGQKDFITVVSKPNEEICSIKINISLILLDRLLENKSELYQSSGKKMLYIKEVTR